MIAFCIKFLLTALEGGLQGGIVSRGDALTMQ